MAVLYHENGKLQSASFPSTKDDSSGGVLTRDQIRTCNWTILCLLNMYEIKSVGSDEVCYLGEQHTLVATVTSYRDSVDPFPNLV